MKKILLCFLVVYSFADVSVIINEIKQMEQFRPYFEKLVKYNIFTNTEITDLNKTKAVAPKKIEKSLVLNAIFQSKANINGKWVKKGDYIEGYRVLKITQKGVYLKKDKKIILLAITLSILKVKK